MSNYSIFQHNVMHAFGGHTDCPTTLDEACRIFLAQGGDLAAEALAIEWLGLAEPVKSMLSAAMRIHGVSTDNGALSFIRDRHWHWRTQRQKTPFREAA